MPSKTAGATAKCGFTLTELAIVLGIIGLILGAIWTAASKVYANNRVTKSVNEVLAVVGSVRNTYAGRGVVSAAPSVELTSAGVNFGWFPSDMVQTNPVCATDGLTTCPVTVWNSEMLVYGNWAGGGAPATPAKFEIYIVGNGGIPAKECPAFMAAVVQQAAASGLDFIYSDATGGVAVTTATSLTISQITSCSANVLLEFTL